MKKTRKSQSSLLTQTFRFQPGLVLGIIGLAFLGGGVILNARATNTTTTDVCQPMAVSDIAADNPGDSQVFYTVKSSGQGGSVTASVKAGANCVGPMISLVAYKTTSPSGEPLTSQVIYDSQSKAMTATQLDFSVKIPNCYYQLDLAYGQPLDLATGDTYHSASTFIWGAVGGTKACTADANPTPSASSTPRATVSVLPVSPSPAATAGPQDSVPTPTSAASPKPNPGSGGSKPTPSPKPVMVPLGPGESTPPPAPAATVLSFLPQTGKASSFMTFLGALLITAGLFHIYLTQRRKLIKSSKLR